MTLNAESAQKILIKNILIDPNLVLEEVKSLAKYHTLVGNLCLKGVLGKTLPSLEFLKIYGNLVIEDCNLLWNFPNLESVSGNVIVKNSQITGFEDLSKIQGDLKLKNSTIVHMHNLKTISGNLVMDNSNLIHPLSLESIGKEIFMQESEIVHPMNLKFVNGKDYTGIKGVPITKTPEKTQDLSL